MIDINDVIKRAQELEPLPSSVMRLADCISKKETDLDEIVEIVSFDESLTLKLLRWANSSANAGGEPITSVQEVVMRLGTRKLLDAAMMASLNSKLEVAVPEYGLSEGELWRHSTAAALSIEFIGQVTDVPVPEESFTTALLHDVGKLVLMRYLDEEVLGFLGRARASGGLSEREAESEILNLHHGEVGGLIAQRWELPESIVKGITYHHSPKEIDEPVCYFTQMANVVAKMLGTSGGEESIDPEERSCAMDYLKISESDLKKVVDATGAKLEEMMTK